MKFTTTTSRILAVCLLSGILQAQSPVAVGTTSVTIQLGQPLYCGAVWIKAQTQVQVYCYTSSPNHTWDMLFHNSVDLIDAQAQIQIVPCPTPTTCDSTHAVTWTLTPDPVTAGVVDWNLVWSTGSQSGKFT